MVCKKKKDEKLPFFISASEKSSCDTSVLLQNIHIVLCISRHLVLTEGITQTIVGKLFTKSVDSDCPRPPKPSLVEPE